jgi:hypothetical protein
VNVVSQFVIDDLELVLTIFGLALAFGAILIWADPHVAGSVSR